MHCEGLFYSDDRTINSTSPRCGSSTESYHLWNAVHEYQLMAGFPTYWSSEELVKDWQGIFVSDYSAEKFSDKRGGSP